MELSFDRRWECPSCHHQEISHVHVTGMRMHSCPALGGLTAPLVEVHGTELDPRTARHRVIGREEYVGGEIVPRDNEGRVVMAVITDRADGSNDCTVFAGTAQAQAHM